jgi:hypothetical protein
MIGGRISAAATRVAGGATGGTRYSPWNTNDAGAQQLGPLGIGVVELR